jgi:hypothetical protein
MWFVKARTGFIATLSSLRMAGKLAATLQKAHKTFLTIDIGLA